LTLAQASFNQAAELCKHAETAPIEPKSNLAAAVMTGIVVTYAKPFTRSDGIGTLPTDFNNFPQEAALEQLHQTMLNARHWVYAHRDYLNAQNLAAPAFPQDKAFALTLTLTETGHSIEVTEPQISLRDVSKLAALCR